MFSLHAVFDPFTIVIASLFMFSALMRGNGQHGHNVMLGLRPTATAGVCGPGLVLVKIDVPTAPFLNCPPGRRR